MTPPSPKSSPPLSASDQHPPPYLTVTNIVANIDTSIDYFVEQLSQRNPLKEISVNDSGGKPATASAASAAAPKFTRMDGDYPKNTVTLYEQMVYHRAGSLNLEPLEIFIPTRYKINFEQIKEYFKEMIRRNDPETQELMNLVFNSYGNTPSAMYYRHTIPGKTTTKTGAEAARSSSSGSVFNLDKKTAKLIQFKIDKWHNNYIDWCFYRNANRFFVENQELSKDELVTLKMEFDEVFDESGELMKLVGEIGNNHEKINTEYASSGNPITKDILTPVVHQYIKFFKVIYDDIKKHMPDTLDFIRERQQDLYDYRFDENIKTSLFKTYSDIKDILDSFGDNIAGYPYLKLVSLFQIFTKQIDELNRAKFPTKLKEAFDSSIAQNGRTDQKEYYKTYTLIQYVYWLLSKSPDTTDNPFKNNYDNSSPDRASSLANIKNGDELYPDDDAEAAFKTYKESLRKIKNDKQAGLPLHHDDERVVDTVEKEKKHVRRLIEIYKKNITDANIKNFVEDYMISEDNRRIASYEEVIDEHSIKLKFGIDLLFYVLYFTTNKVVAFIKTKKDWFDKIDDKNGDLQVIRQEIQLKESKLTHIFDLISKLVGVPVERIIPDRITYYAPNTDISAGLIDKTNFMAAWKERISVSASNPTDISKKVNYVTQKMKKGMDKALGIVDDGDGGGGTDAAKKEENDKKMKTHLLTLLEHNTVQVVHMLFAKPRDIWYSPDLRAGVFSASPKWSFFRLEKPEIISNTAFKNFRKILDARVESGSGSGSASHQRLDYILDKSLELPASVAPVASGSSVAPHPPNYDSVFKIQIKKETKPLCVFLIATQPQPQMLAPGKDSANEAKFQNQSFSTKEIEPSTNNDDSVGKKLFKKLTDAVKPDPEKCSNIRGLINEQANEMKMLAMDAIRSGGVDMSIQMDELATDMTVAKYRKQIKDSAAAAQSTHDKTSAALIAINTGLFLYATQVVNEADKAVNTPATNIWVDTNLQSDLENRLRVVSSNSASMTEAYLKALNNIDDAKISTDAAAAAYSATIATANPKLTVSELKKKADEAKKYERETTEHTSLAKTTVDTATPFAIDAIKEGLLTLEESANLYITSARKQISQAEQQIKSELDLLDDEISDNLDTFFVGSGIRQEDILDPTELTTYRDRRDIIKDFLEKNVLSTMRYKIYQASITFDDLKRKRNDILKDIRKKILDYKKVVDKKNEVVYRAIEISDNVQKSALGGQVLNQVQNLKKEIKDKKDEIIEHRKQQRAAAAGAAAAAAAATVAAPPTCSVSTRIARPLQQTRLRWTRRSPSCGGGRNWRTRVAAHGPWQRTARAASSCRVSALRRFSTRARHSSSSRRSQVTACTRRRRRQRAAS